MRKLFVYLSILTLFTCCKEPFYGDEEFTITGRFLDISTNKPDDNLGISLIRKSSLDPNPKKNGYTLISENGGLTDKNGNFTIKYHKINPGGFLFLRAERHADTMIPINQNLFLDYKFGTKGWLKINLKPKIPLGSEDTLHVSYEQFNPVIYKITQDKTGVLDSAYLITGKCKVTWGRGLLEYTQARNEKINQFQKLVIIGDPYVTETTVEY